MAKEYNFTYDIKIIFINTNVLKIIKFTGNIYSFD